MAAHPFLAKLGLVSLVAGSAANPSLAIESNGVQSGLFVDHTTVGSEEIHLAVDGIVGASFVRNGSDINLTIPSTTNSTDYSTGALVVAGGVGISGQVNIGDTSGSHEGGIYIQRVGIGGELLHAHRTGGGGYHFKASSTAFNKAQWEVAHAGNYAYMFAFDTATIGNGVVAAFVNGADVGLYIDTNDDIFLNGNVEITDNLTVTGLIDSTGVEFTPVASNPGGVAANTLWVNSGDSDKLYFGASEVGGGGGGGGGLFVAAT